MQLNNIAKSAVNAAKVAVDKVQEGSKIVARNTYTPAATNKGKAVDMAKVVVEKVEDGSKVVARNTYTPVASNKVARTAAIGVAAGTAAVAGAPVAGGVLAGVALTEVAKDIHTSKVTSNTKKATRKNRVNKSKK